MPNLIIRESYDATEVPGGLTKIGMNHSKLMDWVRKSEVSTPETKWREDALEDYRFFAGEQDDTDTLLELEDKKRPATVYNEIMPKINMLVGLAAQTKHDANAVPVSLEDEGLAELATGVLKHFRTKLKSNRKELECFEHTVKSGRSFMQYYVDSSNPYEPEIKCKRLEGHCVFVDPKSREYDLSDARFVAIEQFMTEDEILAIWPDINVGQIRLSAANWNDKPEFFNENSEQYRLLEVWYTKYDEVMWVIDPFNNTPTMMYPKELSSFQRRLREGMVVGGKRVQNNEPLQYVKSYKKTFYYRIYSDTLIVEEGKAPFQLDRYPVVLYGAYRNDNTNAWFSVVKMMKDPQVALNTMRRQLSHLLQTLPKGMLQHEAGSILNIEEYETRSSDPSFHLEVAPGAMEKVKFVQQPQISPIYQMFDATCSQGMKDSSGIQNEMMGVQTSSREPGVSVRMRQETGLAVIYSLYDNFKESRRAGNEITFCLVQQFVTTATVIRIQGATGQQLIEINTQLNPQVSGFNDITAGKFDIVIEDTTETSSMRLAIMQMLNEMNTNAPGTIPASMIIEYSDLPYTVKQQIKQYEMSNQQMAAEQQKQEMVMKMTELELKEREVKVKEGELEVKRMLAMKAPSGNGDTKSKGD